MFSITQNHLVKEDRHGITMPEVSDPTRLKLLLKRISDIFPKNNNGYETLGYFSWNSCRIGGKWTESPSLIRWVIYTNFNCLVYSIVLLKLDLVIWGRQPWAGWDPWLMKENQWRVCRQVNHSRVPWPTQRLAGRVSQRQVGQLGIKTSHFRQGFRKDFQAGNYERHKVTTGKQTNRPNYHCEGKNTLAKKYSLSQSLSAQL